MSTSTASQFGVLGTGGMGGALYAASSSLASINNELMNLELETLSKEAAVSAEITQTRLNTQTDAATQTENATMAQVGEEYVSAGASLFGCVAGIGAGLKDFSSASLKNEIADTKAFRDTLSSPRESFKDDQELEQIRTNKENLTKDFEKENKETQNAEQRTGTRNTSRIKEEYTSEMEKLEKREKEIKTKIASRRASGSNSVELGAAPSTPTPEQQVMKRWIGTDTRDAQVSGFRGHDEEEAALNRRAAELLKSDPDNLRNVRNSVDQRLSELEGRRDTIQANKQQAWTQTANATATAASQAAGGGLKMEGAADTYTAAVEGAIAQSVEIAERACQDGVRGYEQEAEQLRQAAIQVAQGYQQAAKG